MMKSLTPGLGRGHRVMEGMPPRGVDFNPLVGGTWMEMSSLIMR